jgi:hypothetical protein
MTETQINTYKLLQPIIPKSQLSAHISIPHVATPPPLPSANNNDPRNQLRPMFTIQHASSTEELQASKTCGKRFWCLAQIWAPCKASPKSFSRTQTDEHPRGREWYCIEKNQYKHIRDQLPTKSPIDLKDHSHVTKKINNSWIGNLRWATLLNSNIGSQTSYNVDQKFSFTRPSSWSRQFVQVT